MQEAEKLFTETFITCFSKFAVITSFREISHLGLPAASPHIYDQYLAFAGELFSDPQHDKLFKDKKKALMVLGSVEALGRKMAEEKMQNYIASVDAASLTFAHSVIDSAALNYCQCCFLAAPADWEEFVEKRKISLEELKGKNYEEVLKAKANDYIQSLDRESLLTKAERLFQVCQPPADFSPIHNFTYDRARLEGLDQMRHDTVHQKGPVPRLPNGDSDIWFLQQTANFFMALVSSKYGLKIDPTYVVPTQQ